MDVSYHIHSQFQILFKCKYLQRPNAFTAEVGTRVRVVEKMVVAIHVKAAHMCRMITRKNENVVTNQQNESNGKEFNVRIRFFGVCKQKQKKNCGRFERLFVSRWQIY